MGEGLAVPFPIFKFKGRPLPETAGHIFGFNGFTVSRKIHLQLGGRVSIIAALLKIFLVGMYLIWQFYTHKGYLSFAQSEGISRMQLQHPVMGCNPISSVGCLTNFTSVQSLPYCKQSAVLNVNNIMQAKCEYFDEFDVKLPGYQQKELLVPTRRTVYTQNIQCKPTGPCPEKDKLVEGEPVFFADIEDFTLLIDHSFVNDELQIKGRAWDMIGFYNPCGRGANTANTMLKPTTTFWKEQLTGRDIEAVPQDCTLRPIHRPEGQVEESEKAVRDRGFAMWMSSWTETIVPHVFEPDPSVKAYENQAPIRKIKQGDIISIKQLLDFAKIDLDDPAQKNRYEGVVIVIDIQYMNWKRNTWPNRVPPAYFYSVSLAPEDEFKIMVDESRQIVNVRELSEGTRQRVIMDYHGIFVVVQQGGDIGALSMSKLFLLMLGVLVVETLYRSLAVCCILNCGMDTGIKGRHKKHHEDDDYDPEEDWELEDRHQRFEPVLIREFALGDNGHSVEAGGFCHYDPDAHYDSSDPSES